MRSLLLAPLVLLAACGGQGDSANLQETGAAAPSPGEPDNRIECRPAGAASFSRTCTVDNVDSPQGWLLTVRKEDGGFRRLLVNRDGRISAADGAQPAHIVADNAAGTEVEIGGDRFRLPRRSR